MSGSIHVGLAAMGVGIGIGLTGMGMTWRVHPGARAWNFGDRAN